MDNKQPPKKKNKLPIPPEVKGGCTGKSITLWLLIGLIAYTVFQFMGSDKDSKEIIYSEFMEYIKDGKVNSVIIQNDGTVTGKFTTSQSFDSDSTEYAEFNTFIPFEDTNTISILSEAKVDIKAEPPDELLGHILSFIPFLLLIGFFIWFMRKAGGGSGQAFSFGKSRAKLITGDKPMVTFDDVAGAEEAKEELMEIIEFLKKPKKFRRLGGKIPKGVILMGHPGTGKTLLAKAIAGEAKVPFFSISGSDFVEMFVGVGASRVRDLFEQGKAKAPCIIFIDEIDAVGRHRGSGLGGGHDEREQTLNALLVEMDGFEENTGVIVVAATNRPDVLDPALLRPGRFDRRITVSMPDVKGREAILKVHTRKIPIADDVRLDKIAKITPGFSGADLESLANEAALKAARRDAKKVEQQDFDYAVDRIMLGLERKSMVITPEQKKATAIHESGHAIVGLFVDDPDPIHKVTIVPRGMALGLTSFLPKDDTHTYTKKKLDGFLEMLLGGRAAEMLFLGSLSTGAGNDLEKATSLARKMVCVWGMSEKLGPVTHSNNSDTIFLGREMTRSRDYSDSTARTIDSEIKNFIEDAYSKAMDVLNDYRDIVEKMADVLMEKETITTIEITEIFKEMRPDEDIPKVLIADKKAPEVERTEDDGEAPITENDEDEKMTTDEDTEGEIPENDESGEDSTGSKTDTGGSGGEPE